MSCGARVRPRWRSSIAITRIPGRTCRCRILRNLLVSLQLIAIPTEEMIGENDTHYLFIRLQLVFESFALSGLLIQFIDPSTMRVGLGPGSSPERSTPASHSPMQSVDSHPAEVCR